MKRLSFLLLALLAPLATVQAAGGGTKPYPLKKCLVTDNALGSMGDEQRITYEGKELKFCCKPCIGKFKKSPEKYLAKLR